MSTKTDKNKTANVSVLSAKELNIPAEVQMVSPRSFSLWVRKLMQNWRQGTVAAKGRSDVKLTNKKPWKQKGTGRARAGSARSPLWRGGGVTFGPQPRTRTLKIGKKLKKNILGSLLVDYLERGKVHVVDWQLTADKPKTQEAAQMLKSSGLHDKKLTLFVPFGDAATYYSFINLPQVQVLLFDQPNAFDLAAGTDWIVLNKDLDGFKDMVSRWI